VPGLRAYRRRLILPLAALAAALLGSIAPASASAVQTIPGDHGEVKIHPVGTFFVDHRHVPHVCEFYLDAVDFDHVQQVGWSIEQQPPTGHATVATGSLVLKHGKGTSAVMSLPAGHYKLVWTLDREHGEHDKAKFEVFWSDCTATASPSPSTSASASPSTTMMSGGGTTAGPVTSSGRTVAPGGKVVGQSLAETGVTLTPWLASGAALLLGGGWLMRRTRGRRQI
jgi:hypothetical protein